MDKLRAAGLRPTRQRVALAEILFGAGDRHISAELLHAHVRDAGHSVSLATIYNTLHQFKRAGLIRELAIDGTKSVFDTNTSNHSHFYNEETGEVFDIDGAALDVLGIPQPPEGLEVRHVDVIVRVARAPSETD
jgi:Fur family iron response transcriptional regulator